MKFTELSKLLKEQNEKGYGFQIHLNTGNLDEKVQRNTDVEFGDLYFTDCMMLKDTSILAFSNGKRQPISHKDDGTPLYSIDINGGLFINIKKIECIENVEDCEDWFLTPVTRAVNLYMYPDNNNVDECRNIVTVGFMKQKGTTYEEVY